MKRSLNWFVLVMMLAVFSIGLGGCGRAKVPAGYVGIKINSYGSSKGVPEQLVGPGKYWLTWNEEMRFFPTFMQTYNWTMDPTEGSENDESITFQTKEGVSVNTDVGISYTIPEDAVVAVFQKYRRGVEEITDTYMRNIVRDAMVSRASVFTVESLYGVSKTEFLKGVEDDVKAAVGPIGIKVDKVFFIGTMRLPESIAEAINQKINATQRAQQRENELREAEAQAKKEIAIAEGQARANQLLSASLSQAIVNKMAIEKWDGKLPTYTGGPMPFLNLQK